ncbi:MAG: cell division protein FtsA, partial [Bdellovibrionales bacterium]|nr:cell division protein FtsA [Bdellovibrionales bacterium]
NSAFASISGSHISGFNSHGIVGIKNKEVSNFDIEKVIEAAKAVAIPLDREVLHVLSQEYIIDEQDGIKEPLGISGVRLEARVHIVTGSVASAQNVVKCANRCGLTVRDIVLSPLAAAKACVTEEEKELGVALVDIGGGTTDVTVFHQGAVKYTAVVSIGGSYITNDIAAGLRTPISAAEEIKKAHGYASASQVKAEETIEVPSTGGREARVLSKLALRNYRTKSRRNS